MNLYPEFDETGLAKEKSIGSLIGTPGLSSPLVTLATSPVRGHFVASNGTFYVVSGNTLYTVSSSWVATSVGTLNTAVGPVSMADNGVSLMLVDGVNAWYSTLGSGSMTQVTSANYLGASNQVVYQDGVFIFLVPNSNEFFVSNQLDVTFSGYFDHKASQPDNLIGIFSDHRNLWLFGAKTTEVWFDAGNPPPSTPFSLIQGGFIETGCASPFSIKRIDNKIFFVGQDDSHGIGTVFMIQGFQPARISTHAIELAIQSYGDISGTTAWNYQDGGHNFYCLNFKNSAGVSQGNTTWCYDLATGLWHERVFLSNGAFQRSLIETHSYVFNTHVVGDYSSGNLYQLSSSIYSDNGAYIPRERTFPHMNADMKRMTCYSFQLDLEPGTGLDGSGQGTNPQAMLQFSDDGGHSWSNEKWTSVGAIGQTKFRAIWRRLGRSRDKIFKIRITDPVKTVWIGATLNEGVGYS